MQKLLLLFLYYATTNVMPHGGGLCPPDNIRAQISIVIHEAKRGSGGEYSKIRLLS